MIATLRLLQSRRALPAIETRVDCRADDVPSLPVVSAEEHTAPSPPSMREIRPALAAVVEATSLRKVAGQVGVSPTGLQKTLDGAAPYGPTLRKYRDWYLVHGDAPAGDVHAGAIEVLLRDIAPSVRPFVEEEIRASLAGAPRRVLELLPVEPVNAAIGEPPRPEKGARQKKAVRPKPPSLQDVRAAVAHLELVLENAHDPELVMRHVGAAVRALGLPGPGQSSNARKSWGEANVAQP